MYAAPVLPKSAIRTKYWACNIPVLDQLQLGSCVPNAGTHALASNSSQRPGRPVVQITPAGAKASYTAFTPGVKSLAEDTFAVPLYHVVTSIDSYPGTYPPDDTGSDGVSLAKAFVSLGLADSYTHAFSVDALKSALMFGPVLWGTVWMNSMFDPDTDGNVVVDRASGEAGGHELLIVGYDLENDRYLILNSWGAAWGINGTAWVSGPDMAWLLAQQGDVTIMKWSVPSPIVVPVTHQAMYDKIKEWYAPGPAVSNRALKAYADQWAHDHGLVV
jgi:hypothetical protein